MDKIKSRYVLTCDDCGEILDTDSADFREAVDKYKEEGWTFSREAGEAMHFCKDCSEESIEVK